MQDELSCVSDCPDGYYLDEETQTCMHTCEVGKYPENATQKCEPCDPGCTSCFGPDLKSCYSCDYGFHFTGKSECTSFGEPTRWEVNNTDNGWVVPKDGENVVIPKDLAVMISKTTAAVDTLIVDGVLYVNPNSTGDVLLNAQRIFVREGTLYFNGTQNPDLNFTIYLSSSNVDYNASDSLGLSDDSLNFVDKSIVVLGTLTLAGYQKTPYVRLTQSVEAGHQTIFVDGDVSTWAKGDKIVLASTGFDTNQAESFIINEIHQNQIALDKPAQYYHYGSENQLVTNYGTLDNRGEVAMLSSNARIESDDKTLEACQVYVA